MTNQLDHKTCIVLADVCIQCRETFWQISADKFPYIFHPDNPVLGVPLPKSMVASYERTETTTAGNYFQSYDIFRVYRTGGRVIAEITIYDERIYGYEKRLLDIEKYKPLVIKNYDLSGSLDTSAWVKLADAFHLSIQEVARGDNL